MIYLDCAATSLQKPPSVAAAMARAADSVSSPGRGAYASAMEAAELVFRCRQLLSELFAVPEPENVVFTMNATHSLNIALHSLIKRGDKVAVSGYEHNAVTRTLYALGAEVVAAKTPLFDRSAALDGFEKALDGAAAAVCSHVSNVYGFIQPLDEIARLCMEKGVPLIVDASQSAGCLPLDMTRLGAAFIAMPGHKGLLGPQGTGVLLCGQKPEPLLFGGTGSMSLSAEMPPFLPDALEAGTHNVPGIAGLLEGTSWVKQQGSRKILLHEQWLMRRFAEVIRINPRVMVYLSDRPEVQAGVLSVSVDGIDCEELAAMLAQRDICVRAGLHCAPLAHETGGTLDTGTVRFSFSLFNTTEETDLAAENFLDILKVYG